MKNVSISLQDHVAVLSMNSDDNRFNPSFLDAMLDALDRVETETDATTLIVTSSHEKIFSNGLDLEWLVPVLKGEDLASAKSFFYQLNALFRKIVTYPLLTIAAINGHAFAGGAIFATAFDFRFMRSDRGYFCLPEVDLGIPFLPGMIALLRKAIPEHKFEEMAYSGARLTASECEAHHIVTRACPQADLLKEAMAYAALLNKKREIVREFKNRLNRKIIRALDTEDPPIIESGLYNIGGLP